MEVKVNHDMKLVQIWLTKADQEDAALMEGLRHQYQVYKEKKYMVAQFHSGAGDLYGLTRDLVLYNRKRIAQMEVRKEKMESPNLSTSYCGSVQIQC